VTVPFLSSKSAQATVLTTDSDNDFVPNAKSEKIFGGNVKCGHSSRNWEYASAYPCAAGNDMPFNPHGTRHID